METRDWNDMPEEAFRHLLREFIAARCPGSLRHYPHRFTAAEVMPWYLELAQAGFLAPGWPPEHGGMGLTPARHLIFIEEMETGGTPWLHDSGVRNLGPAIIAWGTEAQKARYLPAMLAGEHIWCQGYSEPASGSDLASLSCEARQKGGSLILNGQKIWTTSGDQATHMFGLFRTDRSGRKQEGITFLLVDMALHGITVRPIENLNGRREFCEVFFDNVEVPLTEVLGALHQGWAVARSQLGFERIWAGSPNRAMKALGRLRQLDAAQGLSADPVFRDLLARLTCDTLDAQDLYARFADLVRSDGKVGVEVSALKIWSTRTFQEIAEALREAGAELGTIAGEQPLGEGHLDLLSPYHESRAPAIFAGTNEIHRNILARSVLGVPKSD